MKPKCYGSFAISDFVDRGCHNCRYRSECANRDGYYDKSDVSRANEKLAKLFPYWDDMETDQAVEILKILDHQEAILTETRSVLDMMNQKLQEIMA